MTLPIELGKRSTKGTTNVFLGMVVSTAILAVGSIVISNLLGSELYGLYAKCQVPIGFLNLCVSFGVYFGIMKYLSQYHHRNETEKIRKIITSGFTFIAISSSIFALISFLLSNSLADFIGSPNAGLLIQVLSLTVFTDALLSISMFTFVSLEKTKYYTALLIFQAVLATVISPLLIVIGFSPLGAIIGYTSASLCSSVLAMFVVFFLIWKRLGADSAEHRPLGETKMLIRYGFPLYLRDLVLMGIRTHFLNFLILLYISNDLFGNYKVALNFQTALNFIYVPISTILFPTFSKLDIKSDRESLKTMFVSSAKYTSLLIAPVIAALLALSEPLVFTLYKIEAYSLAPFYLSLSALTFIYAAFGQTSIVQLLGSQGQTGKTMILGIVSAVLALVLALILVPRLQIVGLIVSLIISGFPTVVLGSWWVKKLYNFSIDWNQTGRILACSFCASIVTFAIFRYFLPSNLLGLVIGLTIFLTLFLVLSPLMGAIIMNDISNLRSLISETASIRKVLEIPLWLLSKSCGFADRVKKKKQNV